MGRRTAVAVAGTAVALVVALLPLGAALWADTAGDGPAALPDRLGGPVPGALHVADWPHLTGAAVVFSGDRCVLGDECDTTGVVSAGGDRYRVFDVPGDAPAGMDVLLSPDGRRIAYPDGPGAIDLPTGGALAGKGAWTPDAAAVSIVTPEGGSWRLRYYDPVTGKETRGPATPMTCWPPVVPGAPDAAGHAERAVVGSAAKRPLSSGRA